MRTLLYILFAIFPLNFALADEDNKKGEEIILPVSPKQKVLSRFKKNFAYHHDRGFYLSASFGPSGINQSNNPQPKASASAERLVRGGMLRMASRSSARPGGTSWSKQVS